MRSLWVFLLVVLLLGPSATSVSADEKAEVQRLRGTISALEGRIHRLEAQVRRFEAQVERLEGRLARALDRDEPVTEEDVKSTILKAMYRLAEHAEVAGKDAQLMRALADLYGKIDKAERDRGDSRRGRGRTGPSRRTGPTDAETQRPKAILGVALEDDGTVSHVLPGSPAKEAGIKAGDVIRQIDGRAVEDAMAIVRFVARKKPGDRITLELLRGEEKTEVQAVLAERPDP